MARRLPKSLPRTDCDALVAAAVKPRDRLIVQLGLVCGLRVSEITGLEVSDMDSEAGMVLVRHGKGDKDRVVPCPSWLVVQLQRYLAGRLTGYVFPGRQGRELSSRTVQRLMKRLAKKAGIVDWDRPRRVNPHRLRHTAATTLLRAGADIVEVAQYLGHGNIATTQLYVSADPQRLRLASERAFGRPQEKAA